ncbi:DUF3732 domain-containing protein [Syntrophobacter fumaroxidans]|uniref:DUF3732 domain-containing protein n=1 Tax=Syntrophobacter fumaroxidans (strain DSM 10017 / MPOB) TaxID=335543 RepID=A0LJV4_SYNFM|nr:DUF3732 domain-containing protein [Syntrophobacter fumaroxidans]ABK17706.1 conserved hypothetical protein [Syntrophobacter fumaroxidans MPOB]
MFFQIKEIVLWPKNGSLEPRRLPFEKGKVNVISGGSRTGKSAIIPIIDYCLGSKKCRIPVNTIRNSCEWFGVVVQTGTGEKLFARREPGFQKATGDMFIIEGKEVEVPEKINLKNSGVEAVKASLDELVGLTALDFDTESLGSGFKGRPSFRDLSAFMFQPQNIVANPDVFFYKADTYEHREKLRTIFPYVLDAINPQILAMQHELAQLKKDLRRKQAEYENIKLVSERWLAELHAKISEARELGLIKAVVPEDASREQMIEILAAVAKFSGDEIKVTEQSVNEAIEELRRLEDEERSASFELSELRGRLDEMSALRQSTVTYHGALHIQRDRLKVSEWMLNNLDKEQECPMCGSSSIQVDEKLEWLHKALKEIEKTAGEFEQVPAAFDREFERVGREMRDASERLRGIRIRISALRKTSEQAQKRRYDALQTSRFIGGLEEALQMYSRIGTDSVLWNEISDLREKITARENQISEREIRERTRRALRKVESNAGRILPHLDTERPDDPVSLLINDLTIKIGGVSREDYLWEIGSGSNWLSYHIAVMVGLHQFFLSLRYSPVPSFLILDQPSQVYFPKTLSLKEYDEGKEIALRDEDVVAVRKAFLALSVAVTASKGGFQVIVLDHATENVWGNISNVHLVEEWRDGKKLIPPSWE